MRRLRNQATRCKWPRSSEDQDPAKVGGRCQWKEIFGGQDAKTSLDGQNLVESHYQRSTNTGWIIAVEVDNRVGAFDLIFGCSKALAGKMLTFPSRSQPSDLANTPRSRSQRRPFNVPMEDHDVPTVSGIVLFARSWSRSRRSSRRFLRSRNKRSAKGFFGMVWLWVLYSGWAWCNENWLYLSQGFQCMNHERDCNENYKQHQTNRFSDPVLQSWSPMSVFYLEFMRLVIRAFDSPRLTSDLKFVG